MTKLAFDTNKSPQDYGTDEDTHGNSHNIAE
jgi:hypothetical protein